MNLTPGLIDSYMELLSDPAKHGFGIVRPIKECFEKSEIVTANHILFEEYLKYLKKQTGAPDPLPKVVFYIIMEKIYGQCDGKDSNGYLGYHLVFKVQKNQEDE